MLVEKKKNNGLVAASDESVCFSGNEDWFYFYASMV
jgi:hypothetical protein